MKSLISPILAILLIAVHPALATDLRSPPGSTRAVMTSADLAVTNTRFAASRAHAAATMRFASFSAARIQDLITLNWRTLGERNNFGFEIERRSQYDVQWRTIAFLPGRSTEAAGQEYSYVEKMVENAMVFYRIKQVDFSGRGMYTQAVSVTPEHFPASMNVHRTPGSIEYNQMSFVLPSDGEVRLSVHDIYGREIAALTRKTPMRMGYHVIPFSPSALQAGTYSVRLETQDGTLAATMIMAS